jgi:hypothetical protein
MDQSTYGKGQSLESMPPYWAGFAEYMFRSYGDPRTEEGRKLLAERSPPINKVENIKKPMLIFRGAMCAAKC